MRPSTTERVQREIDRFPAGAYHEVRARRSASNRDSVERRASFVAELRGRRLTEILG